MKNHRYHAIMPIALAAAVASVIPGIATAQLEEVLVTAERRERCTGRSHRGQRLQRRHDRASANR